MAKRRRRKVCPETPAERSAVVDAFFRGLAIEGARLLGARLELSEIPPPTINNAARLELSEIPPPKEEQH